MKEYSCKMAAQHRPLDLEWDKNSIQCAWGRTETECRSLRRVAWVTIQGSKSCRVLEHNCVKEYNAWAGGQLAWLVGDREGI